MLSFFFLERYVFTLRISHYNLQLAEHEIVNFRALTGSRTKSDTS